MMPVRQALVLEKRNWESYCCEKAYLGCAEKMCRPFCVSSGGCITAKRDGKGGFGCGLSPVPYRHLL